MVRLAVGVMSGTSCDGVSAACVEFTGRRARVLRHASVPYPLAFRKRLLRAPTADAAEVCRLNGELGARFVRAAQRVAGRVRIEAIGSHGHTAWHERGATLQIGDPSPLAEAFGVPVVSGFRTRDVAAGGLGAPLVPRFDEDFFGGGTARAMLNVGGIANVTFVGRGVRTRAFDIGPGNMLLDEAARRLGRPMDRGGRIAAAGRVDLALLRRLMAHPFLRRAPPKSTGREEFGTAFFDRVIGGADADVAATLAFFTAAAVAEALRRWGPPRLAEVVVSGGGALNRTLMDRLAALAAPARVRSIAEFGIPPLAKEPAAFAWLALLRLDGKPGNVPAATGARRPVVLGQVTHGR